MKRAFTLWQPWATLAVRGIKKVETRSRRTHIRGKVFVSAAIRATETAIVNNALNNDAFETMAGIDRLEMWRFPVGCIVGEVEIIDCLPAEEYRELCMQGRGIPYVGRSNEPKVRIFSPAEYEREKVLGDLSPGRWAWILANARAYYNTIPAKGSQGFWDATKYMS